MPSTQQQPAAEIVLPPLDVGDNAGKVEQVNELLGITNTETAPPETAMPEVPTELSVAEALAEGENLSDSGEIQKTVTPPKNLDELAEKLGVKVSDLYAIEFPVTQTGESRTFGELKDLQANESDFAGRELQFEERRVEFRNDQAKARQELELVLQSLPEGAIKPDILAKARKEREVMLNREAARVIDVIPEWKSDETKRADFSGIGDHLAQYGFDKSHIEQIADHRMLRYMRDNFVRMELVKNALSKVKTVKTVPKGGSSKPKAATPKNIATPTSTLNEQLAAVDDLIKTG